MKPPPTYEELRTQRQREWERTQQLHQEKLTAMAQEFANSPDVRMRPPQNEPFSYPGIVHVCEPRTEDEPEKTSSEFFVEHWVTVSGIKHRWDGRCKGCAKTVCWDWNEGKWLVS